MGARQLRCRPQGVRSQGSGFRLDSQWVTEKRIRKLEKRARPEIFPSGARRSRARRAVDAAPRQWHTVRGHRLSEKSELPRKPRCQAWHAPGGLDLRPPARHAGTAWREDRAVLRAGRWARTGAAKPTLDRQVLRRIQDGPHPHPLAQPQKLTGYQHVLSKSLRAGDCPQGESKSFASMLPQVLPSPQAGPCLRVSPNVKAA